MIAWLTVFAFAASLDFLTTKWYQAAKEGRPLKAGMLSALISGLGTFAVIQIVGDTWLLMADIAGSFIGSYVGVKWHEARD